MEKIEEKAEKTELKQEEDENSEYTYEYEEEKAENQQKNENSQNKQKESENSEKVSEKPQTTDLELSPPTAVSSPLVSSPSSAKSVLLTSVKSPYVITEKRDVESSNTVPPIEIEQKTELDYIQAINLALTTGQKPDPEIYSDVYAYANRRLAEATIDEDYDTCESMNKCIVFLEENNDSNKDQQAVITVDMRIEQAKKDIEDVNAKYDKRIEDFEKDTDMKLKEILADQEAEMEVLENNVSSPEFLHQFDKPSVRLQQLRVMQKEKAMLKDFAGAKEMKKIGDELEKKEIEIAKQKVIEKITILTKQKEEKHETAIQFAKQNWERRRQKIEQDREAELEPLRVLLSQLENKGHQSIKYAVKTRSAQKKLPRYGQSKPVITPRTMKSVNTYKIKGQSKLNLEDFEPRKYVRTKSAKGTK